MNDALMGILRVRNLISPPYVSVQPHMTVHEISSSDQFVVLGSDGLFDFFSNDEVVKLVHSYILCHPSGDPAKFLVEQLVMRAADCAGTISLRCITFLSPSHHINFLVLALYEFNPIIKSIRLLFRSSAVLVASSLV